MTDETYFVIQEFMFPGLRYFIKKNKGVDIEPQEVFLDKLARRKEEELGISQKILETPLSRRILQAGLVLFFLLIIVLFCRIIQIQFVAGRELSEQAERNKFTILALQATRGVIYDRNLNQIVFNQPAFDLLLNKSLLESEEELKEVAKILKKDFKELKKKIEQTDSSQVLIEENLEQQSLVLLKVKIDELPGFTIRDTTIRHYKEPSFSHILGYTGKTTTEELKGAPGVYSLFDYVGRDGLEKFYEKILRKRPGELRIERNAKGDVVSRKTISLPEPGKSLVLWLDADLQNKISEVLKQGIERVGAYKGVAVALDPKTGGVLALVSFPFFDNNLFNKKAEPKLLSELLNDPAEPLFNRAISGLYPVGSVIKPLIAAAALEEEIISPQKKINDDLGFISIPNPYYPDTGPEYYIYYDWEIHGWTDMRKAIAQSCNVYFYTIGGGYKGQEGLGPTRLKKYLQLFGWGQKTGIDLPGEKPGLVPDSEWKKERFEKGAEQIWRDGDTYNLSIGQGYISITALQVASAFVAVANRGKLLKPRIVKAIIDSRQKPIKEFSPEILRESFISPENLQVVREGMRQAVTAGSATGWLDRLPVAAAAKTGTAQSSKKGYFHNWLVVFAPYDDPQIVLTLLIENVAKTRLAVLPVAKEILEWYFNE